MQLNSYLSLNSRDLVETVRIKTQGKIFMEGVNANQETQKTT